MSNAVKQIQGMTVGVWALLLTLSVLWGASFFFVGVAVAELPPLSIVFLRVGLAALTLHLVLRVTGQQMPKAPAVWLAFLGMGLLNNAIPFGLLVWGQTHIASGLAAILNATTPLFAVIVAGALLADERITPLKTAGVTIGFAGAVVMIGVDALKGLSSDVLAQLACLGAALSYAFAGAFGRRFKRLGVTPLQTATGQVTASSLLLLPIALSMEQPWTLPAPSPETWLAMVALATLGTALAYILYFRILAAAGATNVLLVTFLVPVSAILLGWLLLGERLSPEHFAGMTLIAIGLAAIDGRLFRWRTARPRRSSESALDR